MLSTIEVAHRLTDLCKAAKFDEAYETLYDPKIVSIEAHETPVLPARIEGIAAVKRKAEAWANANDVHGVEVTGPWPLGDRFILCMTFDITPRAGPMAGTRLKIDEAALYTVKGGKVIHEEFFYAMP